MKIYLRRDKQNLEQYVASHEEDPEHVHDVGTELRIKIFPYREKGCPFEAEKHYFVAYSYHEDNRVELGNVLGVVHGPEELPAKTLECARQFAEDWAKRQYCEFVDDTRQVKEGTLEKKVEG